MNIEREEQPSLCPLLSSTSHLRILKLEMSTFVNNKCSLVETFLEPIQQLKKVRGVGIAHNEVTYPFLNQSPIFEWYVVKCVFKSGY